MRPAAICIAFIFYPAFMIGPAMLALWLVFAFGMDPCAGIGAVMLLLASAFFCRTFLPLYHWVEVDNDTIRGRRLFTRQIVECRILPSTPINATFGKERIRDIRLAINSGVLIQSPRLDLRLGNGPRFILFRGEMANVDDVLLAVLDRMEARRESPGQRVESAK